MMTRGLILILAIACGAIVANLYYAQTLVPLIGHYLNLNVQWAGFIVTLTQIGYGCGLLFIVPLADLIENRRLITILLCLTLFSIVGIIFAKSSVIFLLFCFLLGLTAVAAQVIVPLVTHSVPVENRGKVVGNIMTGLFLGIMFARPLSSWLADIFSWRAIFIVSAIFMLTLIFLLRVILPYHKPVHELSYRKLIFSLPVILKTYPALRRRALYHAILFGIFSLFWTSIAMLLMGDFYHYSQTQIALFAFAGALGALTAPIAGRIADRGWTKIFTGMAIILVGISCVIAKWHGGHSIVSLIIAALLLDVGVACNLVLGQRTIFSLAACVRGRLNGLYMTIFFIGGAIGSALAGYLYTRGGWNDITNVELIAVFIVFVYYLTEFITPSNKQ